MIDVVFKLDESYIVAFEVEGHAGFDDAGSDILCSAVSFLSQATLNGLIEILKVNVQYKAEDDGYLNVSIENEEDEHIEKCQVLLKTMLLGIKSLIKDGYGDYVRLFIKEV
ncbi:ribosomal-processing cysteine protease Prp [Clostridium sp. MB40-C1]|uniref:ribosomal-processing cysteine protease Prp n=1 Tax=Clostridium sp. MB40-C1 TaxID=3070996 RepID=UPI0027E0019D|nr:ribosomal-processing cysteine protease Prp [Clostridium sp. MB40-C1]WMJ82343.1 ribosomal-processing cysteine protease Prp [Clostridium sp. MB40-C1]